MRYMIILLMLTMLTMTGCQLPESSIEGEAVADIEKGVDEEAEELLETLTGDSSKSIPRFQSLAEKLLENIRDTRAGSANISPITNIRDVLRYLRDAKTMIESQPR